MIHSHFFEFDKSYISRINKENECYIIGLDEAGRGPIAGPIYVSAFTFASYDFHSYPFLDDSKKLSFYKRKDVFDTLVNHPYSYFSVFSSSSDKIDSINNISTITSDIMISSMESLIKKVSQKFHVKSNEDPLFIIFIDGKETCFKLLQTYLKDKKKIILIFLITIL